MAGSPPPREAGAAAWLRPLHGLQKRAAAGSGTRTWDSCDARCWTRDSWISPTGAAVTAWALRETERHYAGRREPLMGPLAAGRSGPARAQRDRQSRILNFQDGPTRREGNGRRGNWDAALKLGTCVKQHSAGGKGVGLRPAAEVKRALVETEALPESYRRAHLDLDQRLDRPPLAKRAAAGSGTRTWESCDACRRTRDSWISPTGAAGTAWALQGMERHYAGQREPLMVPLAAGRSRPARAQR
ncbi:hypothetical protein NDU88_003235 [Pleurodeles waltl]|uniref:Uncharacterized protein n=1 Tax=Pleurodeles waltl TaxID=8319 RepID=A0AAV7VCS4_PLEWA|nr:hypothetical protein NDU88_003235 [Pleurodeles waltl]